MVTTIISKKEGPFLESQQGTSCVEFNVLPVQVRVLSGQSGLLPPSRDVHVRLIGDSKLTPAVSLTEPGCLSL